jgi:hypothetical protein
MKGNTMKKVLILLNLLVFAIPSVTKAGATAYKEAVGCSGQNKTFAYHKT